MKRKLFVLLAMSALMLGACAKDNTSSVSESSVAPTPSSETTSTPESSEQSSEQSSEVSSEVSSEEESSSEESSSSEEPVVIEIHSVTISGIVTPVEGEQAKFDFVVDNEHVSLDMETTAWTFDVDGNDYFFAHQGDEKTFESGTIYGLSLKLVTEDNAKFASDATISIIIDGDPIELDDVYWGSSHTTATAEYHFDKLPGVTPLHFMQVFNLPDAAAGDHPASLTSILVEPSRWIKLNGTESNFYWVHFNNPTPTFFARGGDNTKTFEAGTEYGVCFIVECKNNDEYAFADDLSVTTGKGTVFSIEKCGTGGLNRRITISYGVF